MKYKLLSSGFMHILVIEDEITLLQFLLRHLSAEAFSTFAVSTRDELQCLFLTDHALEPDVVILDRMFWDEDLSHRIFEIKAKFKDTKILVLSAIGNSKERAKILETGADDYLNKPFDLDELIARIRCLVRRGAESITPSLKKNDFGFYLNEDIKDVEIQGQRLNLTKKEYQLVSLLTHHPNKVFSRLKLLDSVWDIQADIESNVVEATISNVRKKFEKNSINCRIQSRRNIGYWLEI